MTVISIFALNNCAKLSGELYSALLKSCVSA
jgi:hypothetical protein